MTFDPARFLDAQAPVYDTVVAELQAGRKTSHWMWFIFPQVAGLGMSAMSQRFAIPSLSDAGDYLAHPVLGTRLQECTALMLTHADKPAVSILGGIDAVKFGSSMTLFAAVPSAPDIFVRALDAFYDGARDPATLAAIDTD